MELDETDKKLLNIIQTAFPLVSRPYAVLGGQVGIAEAEALERINRMREGGLIRRLGANFQSKKLGFVSTLCAAKVPQETLAAFIERINLEPGVTHNYQREHEYNIWFTLISPSAEDRDHCLQNIEEDTGIEIMNLPASKLYKIKVDFHMSDN